MYEAVYFSTSSLKVKFCYFFNPSQWVKNNHFLPGTVAFLYRPQPHGKPKQEGLLCTPSSPGQTVTKAKKENNNFAS